MIDISAAVAIFGIELAMAQGVTDPRLRMDLQVDMGIGMGAMGQWVFTRIAAFAGVERQYLVVVGHSKGVVRLGEAGP